MHNRLSYAAEHQIKQYTTIAPKRQAFYSHIAQHWPTFKIRLDNRPTYLYEEAKKEEQKRKTMSEQDCTRRDFFKTFGLAATALGLSSIAEAGAVARNKTSSVKASRGRPNVLFLAVDDLRPELGCYGHKLVHSPNIDKLASQGMRFDRAYCQVAICSPSRASLMTGLRPDSAGVVDNITYFRDTVPDVVTLPQHFRNHGYKTVYIGKIYHGTMRDEEESWSRKAVHPKPGYRRDVGGYQLAGNQALVQRRREEAKKKYPEAAAGGMACGPATECADVPAHAYQDGRSADAAVATIRQLKGKEPFFLAAGFHKPHLPFVAPKKYWDLYDPKEIDLADNPFIPKGAPSVGMHSSFELRVRHGVPKSGEIPDDMARNLIHGYLACVSYVDAQIGRVIAELERLGLRENTIIMLWGDHGWHLGEHTLWGKATNFEVAARSPLIVSSPDMKSAGHSSDALVELLDMYPSLCELAGLPVPEHLEGTSFVPLLDDPKRRWKSAAFSQFPCPALREWAALPLSVAMRGTFFGPLVRQVEQKLKNEAPTRYNEELYNNHLMGYSMRTDRHRFTIWIDVRHPDAKPIAVELYDHHEDADENTNIAGRPENAPLVSKLIVQLKRELRIGDK
jgi:iduronate 2-sulfatase